jgi:DNA-binding PadR family transcriptional regulator
MSPRTTIGQREAEILMILVSGEKYGRAIRDEVQKRTNRAMPLGSLYTTLDRLEDKGFINSWMGESEHDRGGNRRKYYRITASGRRSLDEVQTWAASLLGGQIA